MTDTKKIAMALAAIILSLSIVGCMQQEKQKGKDGPDIVYPDSEMIQIPSELEDRLKQEVLPNSTIKTYVTDSSLNQVRSWYREEMEERGWKEVYEGERTFAWRKEGKVFTIFLVEPEKASSLLNTDKTVYLLVRSDFPI